MSKACSVKGIPKKQANPTRAVKGLLLSEKFIDEKCSGEPSKERQLLRKPGFAGSPSFKGKNLSILLRDGETSVLSSALNLSSKGASPKVFGDFRDYLCKKAMQKRENLLNPADSRSQSKYCIMKNSSQNSATSSKGQLLAITQKYQSRGDASPLGSFLGDHDGKLLKNEGAPLSECRAVSKDTLITPKKHGLEGGFTEKKRPNLLR